MLLIRDNYFPQNICFDALHWILRPFLFLFCSAAKRSLKKRRHKQILVLLGRNPKKMFVRFVRPVHVHMCANTSDNTVVLSLLWASQSQGHKDGQIRTRCPLTCCPRTRAPLILRVCLYTPELHTTFLLLRCVCRCVWWAVRGRGAGVFFGAEQRGPLLHHLPIHSLTDPPPFGKRRSLCVCASEAAPVSPSVPRGIQ